MPTASVWIAFLFSLATPPLTDEQHTIVEEAQKLHAANARYAPVDIVANASALPESEQRALSKLIQAAQLMDGLFMRQIWAGNDALMTRLSSDHSVLGIERLKGFSLNKGPWPRIGSNVAFIPDVPLTPSPGGSFYPPGVSKSDIQKWWDSLEPSKRKFASGMYSVIRQRKDGKLEAVPYSAEYGPELALCALKLRQAASLTREPKLKTFLQQKAEAMTSNNYLPSDVAWLEMDGPMEPIIGPSEVDEDALFNAKANFEAIISIRDEKETAALAKVRAQLQDIEDHLPMDPALRNPKVNDSAPIRIVNAVFISGALNAGGKAISVSLPADEAVRSRHGTKQVMLKNIQEAKFEKVVRPLSWILLPRADHPYVSFQVLFAINLLHELMHELGPQQLIIGGKQLTTREALQEQYAAVDYAKGDLGAVFAIQHLIDKGFFPKPLERQLYVNYLVYIFRAIRLRATGPQGRNVTAQLNRFLETGALTVNPDGTFSAPTSKMKGAIRAMLEEVLSIEATGNRARAKALFEHNTVLPPEVHRAQERMGNVPVDIDVHFVTAEQVLKQFP